MDPKKRARRQSFRIIISEIIMVLAVVVLVSILALLVSGYWLNSDFKIERQGMLQVSSIPSGANVEVDGDAPWYQRTNTSKVLSVGEHEVSLTKDGYDSWSKTINIREGLLYRLRYPRIFLKERTKKSVYDTTAITMATISKESNTAVLINNTSMWTILDLSSDTLTSKPLDVSSLFTAVSKATDATTGLFTGKIINTFWSGDNEHLLIQSQYDETSEWVLIDIKNIKSSVNLTREFGTNFSNVTIFNNSASSLLALRDQKLYKISIPERQISSVLVSNIISYDFYDQDIIFTAAISTEDEYDFTKEVIKQDRTDDYTPVYYTGIIKNGDQKITFLTSFTEPARAYLSRFYDDMYITIITDDSVEVYNRYNLERFFSKTIEGTPKKVKIGYDGSYIFMQTDAKVAVVDMEALELIEWELASTSYGWLNDEMPYSIKDGTLMVYDFDGLNRRELSANVSEHFPATITNDKWLYYFSDNSLIREIISE